MLHVQPKIGSLIFIAVLITLWILSILLVNPVGDFPLNDDWYYGKTVWTLVKDGEIKFTGWNSMTLISHVLYGSLFSILLGNSFTILRMSTLLLGLAGILGTYMLLREVKAAKSVAFIGSLIVMFNPIYYELSYTFMTDVTFYSFTVLSTLFFVRGIGRENKYDIIAGTLFACLATLTRQMGLVVPLSFGIAYVVRNGLRKKTLLTAVFPIVISLGSLISFENWLKATDRLPKNYSFGYDLINQYMSAGLIEIIQNVFTNVVTAFTYYGLFLSPLIIMIVPEEIRNWLKNKLYYRFIIYLVITAAFSTVLILNGRLMPLTGNILFDLGLGPNTLMDSYILGIRSFPKAPEHMWLVLTAAGVILGSFLMQKMFLLLVEFINSLKKGSLNRQWLSVFAISGITVYLTPFIITIFFDRWLISILPLLIIVIIEKSKNNESYFKKIYAYIGMFILIVYAIFSVGATHDYLSWNRARWEAIHFLEQQNFTHRDIDGGFEYNGFYGYDPDYKAKRGKSYWWVDNDFFIIAFSKIPGLKVIKTYSYRKWIPYGQEHIFVLMK
jgi:hypothetical protein